MAPSNTRSYLQILLSISLLTFFLSLVTATSSQGVAAPSPSAEVELICHTDNPSECYPKVFSPTEKFQIIHDDQDIPSGLHVRMNIYTGLKEARLNIPEGNDPALEGLPVDQAVIVVEPEAAQYEPQLPKGAPAYEPVGLVKEPLEEDPGFAGALEKLKEHAYTTSSLPRDQPLDEALTSLEDIAHDIYYGQKIIEDPEALKALFCLLTQRDVEQLKTGVRAEQRHWLASQILSSALQNNLPALRNLEAEWDSLMEQQCPFHQKPLKDVFFQSIEPVTDPAPGSQANSKPGSDDYTNEATWLHTTLTVLSRLMKSDTIRPRFMKHGGMKHLLQVMLNHGQAWQGAQTRAARLVSDTFLDENLGARLGVWPLEPPSDGRVCENEATSLGDECWEYHLENRIKQKETKDPYSWDEELLAMLRNARAKDTYSEQTRERVEL